MDIFVKKKLSIQYGIKCKLGWHMSWNYTRGYMIRYDETSQLGIVEMYVLLLRIVDLG